MKDFIVEHYNVIKALHVIAIISWMAAQLYLPRLFVYHADADKGSELSETLKIMERKLLRFIMNPAMIAAFIFGGLMIWGNPDLMHQPWMHVKLAAVLLLTAFHGACARWRKAFVADKNTHSAKFYRQINEIPTLLMIIIVIMVIVRPF
ncbi:MAG: protoporphyrinogen oxidase HemJ [Micavibrio sp.]|nr:protoporphyrinogen oxidase HemJ [Micavibrio sp.]